MKVPETQNRLMKSKKPMVIHPFGLALFPVLFLYSHNINEVFLKWIIAPAAIILVSVFLLFGVLSYLCPNRDKAGLLVSLLLVYFFAYGNFVGMFRSLAGPWKQAHLWLLPVWTLGFLVLSWLVLRTGIRLVNTTRILNVMAVCLVGFSLINIIWFETRSYILRRDTDVQVAAGFPGASKEPLTCPNIYYIILDGYLGNDVLTESLDYDNSSFLEQLAQKGFFVAPNSRSNYWKTLLSLPSSMNFEYLDGLAARVGIESQDKKPLREHLVNNRLFSFLKRYGYSIVAFASGFRWSELRDVDVYMSAGVWALNDFSGELVYNTPIAALIELLTNQPFKHILQRRRVLYSFRHLADTLRMPQPIFVFAHIACPHTPYVFDSDGTPASPADSPADYPRLYLQQLKYVNNRVIEIVDELLENSQNPPIIILQADHGIRWNLDRDIPQNNTPGIYKECFSILNAYYLPDYDYSQLYDSISPVNSFRVILNNYFGAELELLKDQSYFSTRKHSYNFINVTDQLNQ